METSETLRFLGWAIFTCGGLTLVAQGLSARLGNPAIGILSRWARCLFFAFGISFIAIQAEWSWAYGPLWNLTAIFFLFWFLIESIYLWITIRNYSLANLPVCPHYVTYPNKDEWPMQPHFIRIREWLRENKYRQIETLKANLGEGHHVRAFHFEDENKHTRIQVAFVVIGHTATEATFTISSLTATGKRLITDNAFVPRGGYLPDNWERRRHPLLRSLPALEKRHKKSMGESNHTFASWNETVLDDIDEQQDAFEKTNVEKGVLFPRNHREENGTYTQEGRYKMWAEIICLNFLGHGK